ncbi:acyl-CoA-binding domain-containing protein 5-like [Pristis pectinata]|uniref:acyl-CoA-binding domain-containing protein 5-like n=1 Tax=Pristis pectinata TaxID=685728 RepID=UPI00223C96E1|nr:acyl-CoA-binding domain-containing protein 5-like [Pristis pectinata]
MSGTDNAEQHFHLFEPLYKVVEDMPRPPGFPLKKVPGRDLNCAVDVVDTNHFTSDSESEVFCDAVEELDHEKQQSDCECSQDSSDSQDIGHPPLVHSVTLNTCRPAEYQPADEELHHCQPSCSSSNGEHALVTGTRKKKKRVFASPFLGPEALVKETGLQQVEGGCSQRLRNGLVSNIEDNKRRIHREKGTINLDDKIGMVLLHLQEDMQNVLQRLRLLEDLTASQMETAELQPPCLKTTGPKVNNVLKRTARWLLNPSRRTLIFLVLWPFVAQWIVHVFLRKRRS